MHLHVIPDNAYNLITNLPTDIRFNHGFQIKNSLFRPLSLTGSDMQSTQLTLQDICRLFPINFYT